MRDDDNLSEEVFIDAAAIGNKFSSTTLPNTNTLVTVRQFQGPAITRTESGATADAKTDTAHGVEANVPVLQFWGFPLGLKTSKRKYNCTQNSVTQAESNNNADSKKDTDPGVEVHKNAWQFRRLPLELKKSKE